MNETKTKGKWTTSHIPSQKGRLIVITGTGGISYETTLALARAGGEVIVAGRNRSKGESAIKKIQSSVISSNIHFEELDLADLASVEAAAKRMSSKYEKIDVLINNAAVIMGQNRRVTKDGFELHFGTNYLGHFALTAHLMPLLRKGLNPRVVNVCAGAANIGGINFDDLQSEHKYTSMQAYGQSKQANLIFSIELHRRSVAENWGVMSIAAHPGLSRTDLPAYGIGENKMHPVARLIAQPAAQGALPILFAATSPEALSGQYYGPGGFSGMRGFPASAKIPSKAKDENTAKRLWETSKRLANVDCDKISSM